MKPPLPALLLLALPALGGAPRPPARRYALPLPAIRLGGPGAHGVRPFVDADGYERHFRGVNAVVKGPPWHPTVGGFDFETSLVTEDFALLQAAGVSVIRLGMMWAGVEPQRGQYNYTYIETLRAVAATAATYGIYTLLDMHQDAMSERFCGEGLPAWAVRPSGEMAFPEPVGPAFAPLEQTGFPARSDCSRHTWSSYYFAEASATAFQALYSNEDGLLDAWSAMWRTVATAFKGDTHILGIEVINEPFPGDVIHKPELLRPEFADRTNLQPVYDALAQDIWAVDPTRLFFFAGVPWGNLGSGFASAPGGASNGYRSVLVFHHYEIPWQAFPKKSAARSIRVASGVQRSHAALEAHTTARARARAHTHTHTHTGRTVIHV
ncbi:cellulase family glycosylhydrolase [bacterium]|nr:cellulase family glycosylhydrolase [bacterium]